MTLQIPKDTVQCQGGPMDRFAYRQADIELLVRTYAYFGRRLPYRATGRFEIHPRTGGERSGVETEVWEYVPEWDELRAQRGLHR